MMPAFVHPLLCQLVNFYLYGLISHVELALRRLLKRDMNGLGSDD